MTTDRMIELSLLYKIISDYYKKEHIIRISDSSYDIYKMIKRMYYLLELFLADYKKKNDV